MNNDFKNKKALFFAPLAAVSLVLYTNVLLPAFRAPVAIASATPSESRMAIDTVRMLDHGTMQATEVPRHTTAGSGGGGIAIILGRARPVSEPFDPRAPCRGTSSFVAFEGTQECWQVLPKAD